MARAILVQALDETGNLDRTEETAQEALLFYDLAGTRMFADWTTTFWALVKAKTGRMSEAAAATRPFLDRPDRRLAQTGTKDYAY